MANAIPMLDLTAQPTRMVRTRYLGPTNTKGGRVVAYSLGAGNRAGFRTVPSWNHSLDSIGNHETAARYLVRKIAEHANGTAPAWDSVYCSSEDGGGYVFAFVRMGAEVVS